MHSCIYEGQVRHRRLGPITRQFQYPLFLMYVDLAELDQLFGRRGVWSMKWPAIARFCRSDHHGPRAQPLDESIRMLVESRLGWRPRGPVRLLTHFRYFGLAMNPVSFYYCFDTAGGRVEAVVAEVNNTPWNEQHCYVLDLRDAKPDRFLEARHGKDFHVSPFLPMNLEYRWRLSAPGDSLEVGIKCHDPVGEVFSATLSMHRRPITRLSLAGLLVKYPAMTLQVLAAIYWQALLIWLRGVPFIPYPHVVEEGETASDRYRARLSKSVMSIEQQRQEASV